jgi:hypothetical protein
VGTKPGWIDQHLILAISLAPDGDVGHTGTP